MNKLFVVLAVVALSASFAKADDKGTEFKWGGEVRERWYWDNNPVFASTGQPTESHFQQRNQLHLNAVTSDKLQAYFNLLHTALWGAGGTVPLQGPPYVAGTTTAAGTTQNSGVPGGGSFSTQSLLNVDQAWLWWKVSDMFSLKAGRLALAYGDGLVFSRDDWDAVPNNFDGLLGRFSWDFLDLDVGGGKIAENGLTYNAATSTTTSTDSEIDWYLLHGSIKNLPDALKTIDLFVFQLNGDGGTGAATTAFGAGTNGQVAVPFVAGAATTAGAWNMTAYGLHLKGEYAMVDYRGDAVFESGKVKNGVSATQDLTLSGASMFDLEAGVNFPEFMKARVFANYHSDTGNTNAGQATATSTSAYQPLWWDTHTYAGLMDVWGFGNLTDIRFGVSGQPDENLWLGIEANLLSRTTTGTTASGFNGADATYLGQASGGMFNTGTVKSTNSALGTEIAVWAKHNYGHGLTAFGQFGYLTLGNAYTATGGTAPGNAMQFIAQAQYSF